MTHYCTPHSIATTEQTSKTKFNADGTAKKYWAHFIQGGKICFGDKDTTPQPVSEYQGEPGFAQRPVAKEPLEANFAAPPTPYNTPHIAQKATEIRQIVHAVAVDDRERRIQRQHSQSVAVEFAGLMIQTGQLTEITLEDIDTFTDHFVADLEAK